MATQLPFSRRVAAAPASASKTVISAAHPPRSFDSASLRRCWPRAKFSSEKIKSGACQIDGSMSVEVFSAVPMTGVSAFAGSASSPEAVGGTKSGAVVETATR